MNDKKDTPLTSEKLLAAMDVSDAGILTGQQKYSDKQRSDAAAIDNKEPDEFIKKHLSNIKKLYSKYGLNFKSKTP